MIRKESGELIIDNDLVISSYLTREEFLKTKIGKNSTLFVENELWRSYRITDIKISGVNFVLVLYFYDSNLNSIHMSNSNPKYGLSWDDWSEEKQSAKNTYHEKWLNKIMGKERSFLWGNIWCGYDSKSGGSSIVIRYTYNN